MNHASRAFLAAAAILGACTPRFNTPADTLDVSRLHPISIDATVYDVVIAPRPDDFDLRLSEAAEIDALADAWRARGAGPITVTTPFGSLNGRAANRLAADIRDRLHGAGLPWSVIKGASYPADVADAAAPIVISFTTYVATSAPCGVWSRNIGTSYDNLNPANFGCATQQNLAAMVENPADLIGPRTVAPGDYLRRKTVLERYRAGELTSTPRDIQTIDGASDVFGG